jgi:LCP family protein required for cell wall assembly
VTEQAQSPYFRQMRRRSTARSAGESPGTTAAGRQPLTGARRYARLRTDDQPHIEAATPVSTTIVKTTPIAVLGDELSGLRAAQLRHSGPRWWTRFAAHPIKSAIAAVLLIFLVGTVAVAGPIALRSYDAYQKVFNTPVPQVGSALDLQVNAQGTAEVLGIKPTEQPSLPEWDGTSRITILLMGVDRREDEPSRSDTIILVNIDPVAKTARMVSIPRDLRVFIPGKGVQKINAAYAMGDADKSVAGGGPGLTMRTIEANFGINIDYYAEIDFSGFTKIVDTVGGVTLDVPYPIKDNEYPGPDNQYMRIYFPAGWQHMNGTQVLQYARTRHDDSDLWRSKRQQQILLALRQQAVSLNLIGKAPQLIQDFGNAVGTDLSPSQALQLARLSSEIDQSNITQLSLDSVLTAYEDPEYFFAADWTAVGQIMSDLTGESIVPPNAAIDSPNLSSQISILDGTLIPGLGGRVLEVVKGLGFQSASTIDLPDAGAYPLTQIIVSPDNIATGVYLARTLGVPDTAVQVVDNPTTPTAAAITATPNDVPTTTAIPNGTIEVQAMFPTSTADAKPATASSSSTIIIRLGDDLPDPAWYYVQP